MVCTAVEVGVKEGRRGGGSEGGEEVGVREGKERRWNEGREERRWE